MARFKVLNSAISRLVDGKFVVHRTHEIVELTKVEAERLLGLKAVAPVNAAGEVTKMPDLGPQSPHIEAALEEAGEGRHAASEPAIPEPADPISDSAPRGNASLEEWQTFARANGATDDELADKTRDQIRDMFGPAGKDDPS